MDGAPIQFQHLTRNMEISDIDRAEAIRPIITDYPPPQLEEWTRNNGYSPISAPLTGETLTVNHGWPRKYGPDGRISTIQNHCLSSSIHPSGNTGLFSSLAKSTETLDLIAEGDSNKKPRNETFGGLEFPPSWLLLPSTGSSHIGYGPDDTSLVHGDPSGHNLELVSNLCEPKFFASKGNSNSSNIGVKESGSNGPSTVSTSYTEQPNNGHGLYDMMAPAMITVSMITKGSAGTDYTPHLITVNAGENISDKIMMISWSGARVLCVLSAIGSVSSVTLSQGESSITYEGQFEIITLSGSLVPSESGGRCTRTGGLSVLLGSSDGSLLGGAISGQLIAASTVEMHVGSFLLANEEQSKVADPCNQAS